MKSDLSIRDPDTFYEALIAANEGLDERQSLDFCLRLLLILANEVGDDRVLAEAIAAAKAAGDGSEPRT